MMISGIEKWDRVTWWGSTRTYSATGEWKRVIVNGPDGCESNEGQQTCAWQTHPYPHPATLTATLTATCTATHTLTPTPPPPTSPRPTLPPYTLHCAVAFLHRLLDPKGLAMAPMLWNLPLLTIMDEVLSHGDLTSGDGARKRAFLAKYGELAGVCRETVRRLMGRLRMGMGGDGGGGGGERGEREGWEGVGVGVQAGVMSPEGGVGGGEGVIVGGVAGCGDVGV